MTLHTVQISHNGTMVKFENMTDEQAQALWDIGMDSGNAVQMHGQNREQVVETVYLIQYISTDGRYTDYTIDEDYGFFLTKESAAATVEELENWPSRYERMVAETEKKYAAAVETYGSRKPQWDALNAAGLTYGAPEPKVPVLNVEAFESWRARQESTMAYVAVPRGGQKAVFDIRDRNL